MASKPARVGFITMLWSGLLTGTLDALAAIANTLIFYKRPPQFVFELIAAGLLGKQAFNSGWGSIVLGISLHYAFAIVFAWVFFALYKHLTDISSKTAGIATLYGLFVWVVMNLMVIPASKIRRLRMQIPQSVVSIVILILLVGLPLALIAKKRLKR